MAIEIHVWKLTGTSPLVSHNPANTMQSTDDGALSAKKKVYEDVEEARIRLYCNEDGTYYHPSAAIRLAILEAAKGRKINKKPARGLVAGAVFPAEDRITILDSKGKPKKEYAIRKCRVKVGSAGVLRCRPQWDNWTMQVPIEIDTDFVGTDIVTELLNLAGRIAGIGDERPSVDKQKNGVGSCGRFRAELVK